MAEIPDVIPGEPVASEWGNDIRDRTLQRYATPAARSAALPTPVPGDFSYLADTGAVEVYHSGAWRAFLPSGVVVPYAGGTIPPGWLVCNGAAVSRTTYAALFAAIGATYGPGDGSTTFNLPDLRQRFPMGVAASGVGNALGVKGGQIDHVHSAPQHTHNVPSHTHTLGTSGASGNAPTTAGGSHTHSGSTGSAGSHSHSFSDTSGGASAAGPKPPGSGGGEAATSSHTHSVSGTSGSTGSHTHTMDLDAAAAHTHTAPSHQHALGTSDATGTVATGNIVDADPTGSANPPFIALHYIIRT